MVVDSVEGGAEGWPVNGRGIGFMGNPVLPQLTRSQFQFYLGHVIFDRNSIIGRREDRNGIFFSLSLILTCWRFLIVSCESEQPNDPLN